MKESHLGYLACPACSSGLFIKSAENKTNDRIETGTLQCSKCRKTYPIIKFIPRFISSDNYAENFGFQWKIHSKTQLDSYTGLNISKKRFATETGWPEDLSGQTILEVGCGAGRFTEQAAARKAMVVAMDLSLAVEANYLNNGGLDNVLIIQGDVYKIPLPKNRFDKVFCFGVLQHTPDPAQSFASLIPFLKEGGQIAVDVYRNYWKAWVISKYYVRPFTTKIPPQRLYKMVKSYIDSLWPLSCLVRAIPKIGPKLNLIYGIPDHSESGLKGDLLREWTYLDCFDMFSACYDFPQTKKTVQRWFESQHLKNIEIVAGDLGLVVGRAQK